MDGGNRGLIEIRQRDMQQMISVMHLSSVMSACFIILRQIIYQQPDQNIRNLLRFFIQIIDIVNNQFGIQQFNCPENIPAHPVDQFRGGGFGKGHYQYLFNFQRNILTVAFNAFKQQTDKQIFNSRSFAGSGAGFNQTDRSSP